MNRAGGNPGLHPGAESTRTTGWQAQQYFAARAYDIGLGATFSWDCGTDQVRLIQLNANSTILFPTNAKRGATYLLVPKQDATGSRTLAYTAQNSSLGSGTWRFPGAVTPTLTTTASKIDVLTFLFDGTDMLGVSQLNF